MGTLAGREVAAYVVSRAAGWDVVPPTVMRDGPFGPGMCQLWIDHDTDVDLIALSRRTDHAGLRDMAVFDAVVNNADRKIGHLLPVADGHLYGCDHGVCFAEDYKLRTVLWQWRGKTLPRRSLEALRRLNAQLNDGGLEAELSSLVSADEIAATKIRVETLLKHRVHPYPPENWPALKADAAAKDMGEWKVITRDDGSKQWAYKGKPLYYFVMDAAAGEQKGEGRGMVWHIAKP
jgi:uncharacterized repeat protein (TIGR03843 family)